KSGNFVSPFDSAKVKMIFATKHAYGFNVKGLQALIHCGLGTVALEGKAFKTSLNLEKRLKKGDKLFEVDLDMVKANDLSIETPIVFDTTDLKSFKLSDVKP